MDIDAAFNQARPLVGEPSDQTVQQHWAQLEEAMRATNTSSSSDGEPAGDPVYFGSSVSVRRPSAWRPWSLSSSRAGRALVGAAASVAVLVGLVVTANFILGDRGATNQDVAVGVEGASTPDSSDPGASSTSSGGFSDQSAGWSDELASGELVGYSYDYRDIFVATLEEGTEGEGCEGIGPLRSIKRVASDGTSRAVPNVGTNGTISTVTGSVVVVDGPGGISATYMNCEGFGSIALATSAGEFLGDLYPPDSSAFASDPFWSSDGSMLWIALSSDAGSQLAKFDARSGELVEFTPEDDFVIGVFNDGTPVLRTPTFVAIGDRDHTLVGFEEPWPIPNVRMNRDATRALIWGPGMSGFVVADSTGNRVVEGGSLDEVAAAWSPDGHIASVPLSGGPIVIVDGAGTLVNQIDVTASATHIDDIAFFDEGRRLAVSGLDGAGQQHLWTVDLAAPSATATNAPVPGSTEVASAATAVPPTPTAGVGGALPASTPVATAAPSATSIPAFSEEPAATPESTQIAEPPVGDPALPTGVPGTAEALDPLNPDDYTNANIYYFPTNGGPAVSIAPLYPGDLDSGLNNGLVGVITYNGLPAVLVEHIEFVVGSEPAGTAELRLYRVEETGTTDYLVWDQRTMTDIDATWFYTYGVQQHGDVLWVERGFQQGACYFVDAFDMDGNVIDDPDNPWPRPDLEALAADPSGPLCPSTVEVM